MAKLLVVLGLTMLFIRDVLGQQQRQGKGISKMEYVGMMAICIFAVAWWQNSRAAFERDVRADERSRVAAEVMQIYKELRQREGISEEDKLAQDERAQGILRHIGRGRRFERSE
ncbi:MAG: hypothetical protein HC927_07970 [Deltaproteobacteria bacterium]|nr:hypothetical protein [Deltaproteobacteria bacterium]